MGLLRQGHRAIYIVRKLIIRNENNATYRRNWQKVHISDTRHTYYKFVKISGQKPHTRLPVRASEKKTVRFLIVFQLFVLSA